MKGLRILFSAATAVVVLSACGSEEIVGQVNDSASEPSSQTSQIGTSQIDIALFSQDAIVQPPEMVSCTLENGDTADCVEFVVKYLPDSLEIGPFCPTTLDDVGGIWERDGENAGLYRVDESFLRMLDELGFTFFDEDGTVHVAGTAGVPPVDDHACINMEPDESVEVTVRLPANPVMADSPTQLGVVSKVGLSLDGVPIFSDAPSVLQTGHMPVLDTCSGHIDPGGWYHYHGTASDIDTVFHEHDVDAECDRPQDSAALFGYAFDGFPIYGSTEPDGSEPAGLDECNGHVGPVEVGGEERYHYHASADFPNLPPCLSGVVARDNFSTTAQAGVGANPPEGTDIIRIEPPRGERPGGDGPPGGPEGGGPGGGGPQGRQRPDFSAAAAQLGVSEEALRQALREAGGPQADLAEVAEELGVSEDDLREALPPRPDSPRPD